MKKLENMTLPSGRRLVFAYGRGGFQCHLISSKSRRIFDIGEGGSRCDALAALTQQAIQRMMRYYGQHHTYWYSIACELRQVLNEAKAGIPKPRKSDVWGVVR